jgi:hypothetical protein
MKRENLEIPVQVRMTENDASMLDQLAHETRRTRSDMVRFLVSQEYERTFKAPQSNQPAPILPQPSKGTKVC